MVDYTESKIALGGLAPLGIATVPGAGTLTVSVETFAPDEPEFAEVEREWIVPVRITKTGADAFVMAADADEARRKAEAGQWDRIEDATAETVDWEVTGTPVDNS